jgi:hypothetical protein
MDATLGYKKMPLSLFRTFKERHQFPEVAEYVREQAVDSQRAPKLESVARMPPAVQTIFWLWRFICHSEGNGMEVFLLQNQGFYTPQVAEALKVVGADELLRRLLAGVPHAINSPAEFTRAPDATWFQSIPGNPDFPTLQSIDRGAYPALYKDLRERGRKFIIEHADVFFE